MFINIKLADTWHIDCCVKILQNSDLGKAYFNDYEKAKNMLTYAVEQKDVYVALDEDEKCMGFVYYMQKGVFGSYPYLHIIAVKEEYRSLGIGKQLMKYFEENASEYTSTKLFLTVDDFNPRAKKLYENLGYHCVGELPDFYKKGISRTFSTVGEKQYETIGEFWNEMSRIYGRENLRGLGYNWTDTSIEYVIGLIDGDMEGSNIDVILPDDEWECVSGRTEELGEIYSAVYKDGPLKYEIEMFDDDGNCKIMFYR